MTPVRTGWLPSRGTGMAFTTSLTSEKDRQQAFLLFLILAAVFVSALVTCNLIFRKFFLWEPFGEGGGSFEQSVGLLLTGNIRKKAKATLNLLGLKNFLSLIKVFLVVLTS